MSHPRQEATQLLLERDHRRNGAAESLMPLVYDELRLLARTYLQRESSGHTLQPTGLVHEAYLRLIDQSMTTCHDRTHFFAVAARVMRRILVDHARRARAEKRGGEWDRIEFEEALLASTGRSVDLVALDDALRELAELHPHHSQIIELRYFGGLTIEEVAEVLDVSARTVKREWRMARAWLRRAIFPDEVEAGRE